MELDLLTVLGFVCAVFIGLSLGTIGAGGSILTVPILVYMMNIKPEMATAYSLFVVGTTSAIGAWQYMRKSLIKFRTVLIFGIPSIIVVYLIRIFLIPNIPGQLFSIGIVMITKDKFLMLLFSVMMLLAGWSMLRKKTLMESSENINYFIVLLSAVCVGTITGIVGIGGGFIIIPALVLFSKVEMRYAIGTSLLIIAMNSFVGFAGEYRHFSIIHWDFLFLFCLFSVIGIIVGAALSQKLSNEKLKSLFGWFIITLGFVIILNQLEILK